VARYVPVGGPGVFLDHQCRAPHRHSLKTSVGRCASGRRSVQCRRHEIRNTLTLPTARDTAQFRPANTGQRQVEDYQVLGQVSGPVPVIDYFDQKSGPLEVHTDRLTVLASSWTINTVPVIVIPLKPVWTPRLWQAQRPISGHCWVRS